MIQRVIRKAFHLGGIEVSRYNRARDHYRQLFQVYKDYTMIPEDGFIANLELAAEFKDIPGDYVECGVWRGGMSAAIADVIGKGKTIHLFDSFEGLPPAQEIDGSEALHWQNDKTAPGYFDNCTAEESFAREAMKLAGHENVKFYRGWFNETLPRVDPLVIGILRLDGDWYDSIKVCLDHLFPRVVTGGLVIIDDYYAWDGCSRAVHDYLSATKTTTRVHQWNSQIAYLISKK